MVWTHRLVIYETGESGLMTCAIVAMEDHRPLASRCWSRHGLPGGYLISLLLYVVWWQWHGDRHGLNIISTAPDYTSSSSRQDFYTSLFRNQLPLKLLEACCSLKLIWSKLFLKHLQMSELSSRLLRRWLFHSDSFRCQLFPARPLRYWILVGPFLRMKLEVVEEKGQEDTEEEEQKEENVAQASQNCAGNRVSHNFPTLELKLAWVKFIRV